MNAQFVISLGGIAGMLTYGALAHGPAAALLVFLVTVTACAWVTRRVLR